MVYRKKCNREGCGKKYKGAKLSKYCCDSCRVLAWRKKNIVGEYGTLKKILEMELKYISGDDVRKIVEVCLYSIGKWKKEKGKNAENIVSHF